MKKNRTGMVSIESMLLIAVGAMILMGLTQYWKSKIAQQSKNTVAVVLGEEGELDDSEAQFQINRPGIYANSTPLDKKLPLDRASVARDAVNLGQKLIRDLGSLDAASVDIQQQRHRYYDKKLADYIADRDDLSSSQASDVFDDLQSNKNYRQYERDQVPWSDLADFHDPVLANTDRYIEVRRQLRSVYSPHHWASALLALSYVEVYDITKQILEIPLKHEQESSLLVDSSVLSPILRPILEQAQRPFATDGDGRSASPTEIIFGNIDRQAMEDEFFLWDEIERRNDDRIEN